MDENRYLPPKAAVADADVALPLARPTPVVVALVLLAVDWVIGWRGVAGWRLSGFGTIGVISFVFNLSLKALFAWIWIDIARGRNWARIVLAILTGIGILAVAAEFWALTAQPAGVRLDVDAVEVAWTVLSPALRLAAIGLLFGPGRAWFAPRH